jgi:hypothetical protein
MNNVDSKTIVGRQVPPPAEELVNLKFNYRYKNINAGERASFPKSEARQLLEMECPGSPEKKVAELVEAKAK